MGAWLARDDGGSGKDDVDCSDAIASKLGPHSVLVSIAIFENATNPVGVSLRAMAVGQAMMMLTARTPSRAGSLLQFVLC